MNILFLTYQGDIAGSTNSIAYLTKGLSQKGHNIYVGCRKESLLYTLLEDSGAKLIPMTFKSKFDFENMRQIRDAVKRFDIDIINAQSSKDRYTSILANIWFSLKVKVIHTRRQISKSSGGFLKSLFYSWGTSKIVAVSEGVKKSLMKNGIKPAHIEVIYNGTPKEKYQAVDKEAISALREKYDIKAGEFVIGCVSRRKNQGQLLEALSHLKFPYKAIFAGVGDEEYYELIKAHDLKDKIVFERALPVSEVLNLYQLFNVNILPSTMEGLSQSLLEAMYMKIPVIATRAAGNIDLIDDGVNGLFFEDGDIIGLVKAINDIHDKNVSIEKLIENAFETASQEYSIEKTISRYESFFKDLLVNKS